MKTLRPAMIYLVIFFMVSCILVTVARAELPGGPLFGYAVGNQRVYSGSAGAPCGWTWTYTEDVLKIDTSTVPGVTTYKVEGVDSGGSIDRMWVSTTPSELRAWKSEYYEPSEGEWITEVYDDGLVVVKSPMNPGDSWVSSSNGSISGSTGWSCPDAIITATINVVSYGPMQIPLGTYQAYQMDVTFHGESPSCQINETSTETWWVVPYIGTIRWHLNSNDEGCSETEVLTSMKIKKPIFDTDADGKTDIAIYRQSSGAWFISPSRGSSPYGVGFGGDASDYPVAGDYDGDGKNDIAIYRRDTGAWFINPSGGGGTYGVGFGGDASDIPTPFDFDGDGESDIAIYRISTGAWFIYPSSTGPSGIYGVGFGGDGSDIPVPGDYDGDGTADLAIYRKSTGAWFIYPSWTGPSGIYGVGFGGDATDIPVPGDYDGDGRTDIAIYRTNSGAWFIYPSLTGSSGIYGVGFGGDATDKPVPGDYDGDGKTDLAIYRANTGSWFIYPSSTGPSGIYGVGFGGDASDLPVTINPSTYM